MKGIKKLKIKFFDIFLELKENLMKVISEEVVSIHVCNNWEKFHLLCLVIKKLCLTLLTTDVSELPPNCRVPDTDLQAHHKILFG